MLKGDKIGAETWKNIFKCNINGFIIEQGSINSLRKKFVSLAQHVTENTDILIVQENTL